MAERGDSVHSLVIPVSGRNLVLPNAVVAEIVPYHTPEPISGGSSWLLGWLDWRDQRVPLISLEALAGRLPDQAVAGARIAVLNGLGGHPELPFFALVTQGIPRLVRISELSITPAPQAVGDDPTVRLQVLVEGEPAVIPDIDALEDLLLAQLNAGVH